MQPASDNSSTSDEAVLGGDDAASQQQSKDIAQNGILERGQATPSHYLTNL